MTKEYIIYVDAVLNKGHHDPNKITNKALYTVLYDPQQIFFSTKKIMPSDTNLAEAKAILNGIIYLNTLSRIYRTLVKIFTDSRPILDLIENPEKHLPHGFLYYIQKIRGILKEIPEIQLQYIKSDKNLSDQIWYFLNKLVIK